MIEYGNLLKILTAGGETPPLHNYFRTSLVRAAFRRPQSFKHQFIV
jgi:hypothetical protein